MLLHTLASLPFIGILFGIVFVNQVEPYVFGMPLVLAWIVLWVLLASVAMAIVYHLVPRNRKNPTTAP